MPPLEGATIPKLLWHSNAPWSTTGYGAQTALVTPRLAESHDVAISSFYGLEGNVLEHNGITVYPGMGTTYGNECIQSHAQQHFGREGSLRDGTVLTLLDVWVLDPEIWRDLNTVCWTPVDHDPAPPMVRRFFERSNAVPMAMSRFGQERLEDALYCPHAVDTSVYKPIPVKKARERSRLPQEAFVVGMVAANKGNPSRKKFPEALRAFKAFHERHDDAVLYLHTEMLGRVEGVNLPRLIQYLGLDDCVALTDQYRYVYSPIGPGTMASIYSSIDVLLNISGGEGFGIPVLEAASCGVPSIVTDFSAMPEVAGPGWKVDHTPTYTPQMSWQAEPSVEDTVEALEQAYRLPTAARKQLSQKCREHALGYDIEKVMHEHMLPSLEAAQERFAEREPMKLEAVAA